MNQPETTQPLLSNSKEDEIDLSNLIRKSLRKWYWYLACLILAGLLAWISVSTDIPVYQSYAQVLIRQGENKFSPISESDNVKGDVSIGIGNGADNMYYVPNQMAILTSRPLITKTLDELGYEVDYFKVINHQDVESYKNVPFSLVWDKNQSQITDVEFNLEILGNGLLNIRAKSESGYVYDYMNQKILKTGEKINIDTKVNSGLKISGENYSFSILLNKNNERNDSEHFKFVFKTKESLVEKYKENLRVERKNRESSVVSISVMDNNGSKGEDFLDKLIEIYLRDSLNEITNEASNSKILETAITNGPLYPKTRKSYIIALLLGLVIPFSVIFLRDFFHKKIISTSDIESVTRVPITGYLFLNKIKEDTSKLVLNKPESQAAGQFHMLRNKISLMTMGNNHPVITITSVAQKEGKSYTSLNLASSFAQANKKTVLLDLNFRNPGFRENLNIYPDSGVADYLHGKKGIDDIIAETQQPFLHVIPSGNISSDPGALLINMKLNDLLDVLKLKFEVIIIIGSPIEHLAELFQIINKMDFTLIVVRHGVTNKQQLKNRIEELKLLKLKGAGIVVNAIPYRKESFEDYGLEQAYDIKGNVG